MNNAADTHARIRLALKRAREIALCDYSRYNVARDLGSRHTVALAACEFANVRPTFESFQVILAAYDDAVADCRSIATI